METRLPSRGERGQAFVELALTLPIMLMIVMGLIDLSFVLYAHVQVAAACGEGARAGALFPGDYNLTLGQNDAARESAVRNAIYNSSAGTTTMGTLKTTSSNFNVGSDVQFTYYPGSPGSPTRTGEEMKVTVNYRQPVWFGILPGVVSQALLVSTSTRVRIQ